MEGLTRGVAWDGVGWDGLRGAEEFDGGMGGQDGWGFLRIGAATVVDPLDEVEEGLDLALEGGAEVLVQVEDDAQADDRVLLVVRLEQLHAQ